MMYLCAYIYFFKELSGWGEEQEVELNEVNYKLWSPWGESRMEGLLLMLSSKQHGLFYF